MNEHQHTSILLALGEVETAAKSHDDATRYAVRALCRAVDFAIDPNAHMVINELKKATRNLTSDS